MKKVIIYILLLLIVHSCVEEAFRPCKTITTWTLDDEVRDWKVYKEGEVIILHEGIDSIIIRCKNKNHGIEEVQVGICPPDFNEFIRMEFEVPLLEEPISLEISYSDKMAISYFGETMRVAKGSGLGIEGFGSASYRDSILIEGNYFYDVFDFKYEVDSFHLNQLIYSTQEGIVLMEIDGKEYSTE